MLSQFYPPVMGGEEQYVRSLSVELVARGHDVSVATLLHSDLPKFEVVQGVAIHRVRGTLQRAAWLFAEAIRPHAPPFPDPELQLALRNVIEQTRPEIVHAHNWLGYQYLPLKAITGAPLVVSLHDMSLVCATKNYMYASAPCTGPGLAKCFSCAIGHYGPMKGVVTTAASAAMNAAERRCVDMFLPVSLAAAEGNRLVGSRQPYQVMPNFVADDLGAGEGGYEDYLAQLPDAPFLLFVGGLRRIKGIQVLLQAYAGLQAPPPLVLIGYDCADTPKTFAEGVVVLKNWPRGAVMGAWRRSLIGLVPSICIETFGLVVLEAMACGRPVIASRIGGLQEVVGHAETGLLVPPGDPKALRDALELLLRDDALRTRLGHGAFARLAEYRASQVVPRVEHIYRDLTLRASRHSRPRQAPVASELD
ncbi:MAG: glycosyltransferase family 4 protein [Chloroflexota bacterium]|nr:glycosyltransferase family 4 protein [Chloroflexota bacterium]